MLHPILGVLTHISDLSPCSYLCVYVSATLDTQDEITGELNSISTGFCFHYWVLMLPLSISTRDQPSHYTHPTPHDRRTTIGLVVPRLVCSWLAVIRMVCKSLPDDPFICLYPTNKSVHYDVNYSYFIIPCCGISMSGDVSQSEMIPLRFLVAVCLCMHLPLPISSC